MLPQTSRPPGTLGPMPEFRCTATTCKTWTHMYTHIDTRTHTKRKDPDIQHRKDMDVLKIAQNPLNLQTSEMLKAPCQEMRPLPRSRQQGPLVQRPLGRVPCTPSCREHGKVACSHWALSPSGDSVQVDFQKMDTAQGICFSHPSQQRNNPLWHKQDGVGGRPGPGANSIGVGAPEVSTQEPA